MSNSPSMLQAWLVAERRSQAWLADQLRVVDPKVHQTTVSTWCRRKAPIPLAMALEIARITGIKIEHLATPVIRDAESGHDVTRAAEKAG